MDIQTEIVQFALKAYVKEHLFEDTRDFDLKLQLFLHSIFIFPIRIEQPERNVTSYILHFQNKSFDFKIN